MTDSQTIRLLIVDDEQNIRRLCVTVGKGLGFDCSEAESAEAALARAEASAPDLVVTDLKLPGSSGVDLLREELVVRRYAAAAVKRTGSFASSSNGTKALAVEASGHCTRAFAEAARTMGSLSSSAATSAS